MTSQQEISLRVGWRPPALLFGLLVIGPALLVGVLMEALNGLPEGEGFPSRHEVVVLAFLVVLYLLITAAMLSRRGLSKRRGVLCVRHSFYTLRLRRSDFTHIEMQRRLSELDVGIATKTNGIAFPGYKSGHFVDGQGKRIFCALTRGAVLLMKCHRKLDGSAIAIAVDDTEEASQVLAQWAGAAERKAAMQTAGQQEREGRIDLIDTPPC